MDNKKYLGIDWGEKRIGLAIGESTSRTAVPLGVASDLVEVLSIIKEEEIDEVVLGRPIKMSGQDHDLTPAFNDFFTDLDKNLDIPIHAIDERLSSKAADALPGNKKDKAARDAVAAMLILQSYLDSQFEITN